MPSILKKLKELQKHNVLLLCIIVLASILRLYNLGSNPPGFHGDEAAYGYNAYAILKTGTDEYGDFLPLVLRSFEEYKPAFYAYIAIPFIALLGLSETAVRLPSALFGILTVMLLYFLVKDFFKNSSLSLLSSFLLSISPWHINLSRTTSEVVVSMFFLFFALFALTKIHKKGNVMWFVIGLLSSFLSLGTYTASRFFVVIMTVLFSFFTFYKKENRFQPDKRISIFLLLLICIEVMYSLVMPNIRFQQVSIFKHPETKLVLEEQIREDQFTETYITRLFHNKIINFSRAVLQNYSEYFTLDFLALNGGYPKRQKIPDVGLFYIWQIPFLFVGVYSLFQKKLRWGIFLFSLWLTFIIPATITFDEVPNVYRTLVIVPPVIVTIAFGLYQTITYLFFSSIRKSLLFIVFLVFFSITFFEFSYYLHQYYSHENKHQPWYRNYPAKELVSGINQYGPPFKRIMFTKFGTMSYIHILFYNRYDVKKYQSYGSPMDKEGKGFDKYVFVSSDCPLSAGEKGTGTFTGDPDTLYVNLGHCVTPLTNAKLLKTVYWGDGTAAFKLVQYLPQ